jgi:hypothetical protein
MRYRGHAWAPTLEMAASMLVPTLLASLLAVVIDSTTTLMSLEHQLMFPAMLVAMLLRREEYSQSHKHHRHQQHEVTA